MKLKKERKARSLRLVGIETPTPTNILDELEDSRNRHVAEVQSHDQTRLKLNERSAQLDAAQLEIIHLKGRVDALFWALQLAMHR